MPAAGPGADLIRRAPGRLNSPVINSAWRVCGRWARTTQATFPRPAAEPHGEAGRSPRTRRICGFSVKHAAPRHILGRNVHSGFVQDITAYLAGEFLEGSLRRHYLNRISFTR